MWNKTSVRVQNLKPSAIRKYFAVPSDVVTLGIGEPDFTTPDKLMAEAHEALKRGNTHYTANAGLPELRQAISDRLDALYGVRYDPESEIIVTVGASEALYLAACTILNPGDEMIV
ncbi:MAG: aminotransferase class I/II-fold pyridoxal phosphate-dependent enzyme, partial [Anaerolineaceae bacterium]|nr:aminotransferase class I/II-fold pyridoxal phosphate-dependent enzyme [Anaerolineaceae bacterium]